MNSKKRKIDSEKTKWVRTKIEQPSTGDASHLAKAESDFRTCPKVDGGEVEESVSIVDDKQQRKEKAFAAETVVKYLTPYYNDSRFISKVTHGVAL
jgi:hypothetical protein